jgi:dephospho-CoA kinase
LLAKCLNELGVETIDADDIVHELVPEEERRRIADEIFRDPAKRKELEARLHPLVRARLAEEAKRLKIKGLKDCAAHKPQLLNSSTSQHLNPQPSTLLIEIIPLLFECHWETDYDIIICVSSPRHLQVERMTSLRGYTEEQAEARLAAQLPIDEKVARSDYVIVNEGSVETLMDESRKLVKWLKGRYNG